MPEDRPDVVLGSGYGPTDLTSPALAAAAGALADTAMTDQAVTELRIHGASGSDTSVMLEHPTALQVAGGGVTGARREVAADPARVLEGRHAGSPPAGAAQCGGPWPRRR